MIQRVILSIALTLSIACLFARAEDPGPAPVAPADDGRVMLVAKASAREGGRLLFEWTQKEGPTVKIADPSAARLDEKDPQKRKWISETFFIPTEPGVYRFELTVKNEDGQDSKKIFEKVVLPPKAPPVAVSGQDQANHVVGDQIRLNGNSSKTADGSPLVQWQWETVQSPPKFKLDPEQLNKAAWDFKATEAGVYQFTLRVFDGNRWSAPSPPVVITVKPKSLPPTIDEDDQPKESRLQPPAPEVGQAPRILIKAIVAPGREAKLGETLVLDGSASHPPTELHPDFFWHQSDNDKGPIVRQLTPDRTKPFDQAREDQNDYPVWTFKPEQPGVYRFILSLTVNAGSRDEAKYESEAVVYTVLDPNAAAVAPVPPVNPPPANVAANGQALFAHINAEQVTVDVGDPVRLDGAKSTGPEGTKLKYIWGPVVGKLHPHEWTGDDGPQIEFRAEEQGEYGVSLRVTDGQHESSPDQIIITVGPAKAPPTIDLPPEYQTSVGQKLTIEAHISDPKDDKISLKWVCIDPPNLRITDENSKKDISTLPSLVFKPWKPGKYIFKITATDTKGHSATAQTTITVKAEIDRPPTAIVDGPAGPVKVGARVSLDGKRSSSPNKLELTFNWNQESGPTIPGDAPNRKQKTWDFTPKEAGHYVFTLEVADGNAKSNLEKFVLEVVNEQHNLVAKVSGPAAVNLNPGDTITLDGSASDDGGAGKDKLIYKWSKLDGTAELKLQGEDKPKLQVTGDSSGPARLQLVVSDGVTDSAPVIVVLTVGRVKGKPVANITGPSTARVGAIVMLSSEGSSSESEINSWLWAQASDGGPAVKLSRSDLRKKELRFEAKSPGTYVFSLTVVDNQGNKSDPVAHSIEVKGANKPPIAHASIILLNNGPLQANDPVKLSARGSLDPENSPLTYKWKQVSGDPIKISDDAGEVVTVSAPAPGRYSFELTVNDGENDSVPAEVGFVVEGPYTKPVAVIGDLAPVEPKDRIVLDGSDSKASDGAKLKYRWSKLSGPEIRFIGRTDESRPKSEVILEQEGEYVFELKVFDGKEWSDPVQAAVKTRAGNVPPVAGIVTPNNGREIHTEEGMETVLDGSASNDPDNGPHPLTYQWKQTEGTRVDLKADGALARFTTTKLGIMKFQLVVSDGKSFSAPALATVVVMKAGTLPVAVPDYSPKPAKAAARQLKNNLLILDATKSKPTGKRLAYQWKQVGGEDLHLAPEKLNRDRVGLLVYMPGVYRFQLTVSDDQNTSQPSIVEINVIEDTASAAPATDASDKKKPDAQPQQPDDKGAQPDGKSSDAGRRDGALLPPPRDAKQAAEGAPNHAAQKRKLEELSKVPGAEAEKTLVAALSDADSDIRKTAAEALYSRGITSIPALIKTLDSSDANARNEAYAALKELTHETIGPESEKWRDWWAAQPVARNGGGNE